MGGSIFKHDGILGGIFPGFMWDPYRIILELSRDLNVIILASYKNLRNNFQINTATNYSTGARKVDSLGQAL